MLYHAQRHRIALVELRTEPGIVSAEFDPGHVTWMGAGEEAIGSFFRIESRVYALFYQLVTKGVVFFL